MKRSDFFQFTNGPKVPLPFSDKEYENRLKGLRKIIAEKNLDAIILTSLQNVAIILVFFTVLLEDHMPALLLINVILLFQQILMPDNQVADVMEKILFIQIGKEIIILRQ